MVKQQTEVTYSVVQYANDDGMWTVRRTVTADHAKCHDRLKAHRLADMLVAADKAQGVPSKVEGL